MATMPPEELEWAASFVGGHRWTWAKTYEDSYPHEYVVRGKGNDTRAWDRFKDLITTYGHIQAFFKTPRPYLILDGWKYWWIDPVIKRAQPADRTYGVQWAPDTQREGPVSAYDLEAAHWDERVPPWVKEEEEALTRELLYQLTDNRSHVLNVGCGTGRLLRLRPVPRTHYQGIDPSQAMCNVHVMNFNGHGVMPRTLSEHERFVTRPYDLVAALFGTLDHLSEQEVLMADEMGEHLLLMSHGSAAPIERCNAAALEAAKELPGVQRHTIGRWEVVYR